MLYGTLTPCRSHEYITSVPNAIADPSNEQGQSESFFLGGWWGGGAGLMGKEQGFGQREKDVSFYESPAISTM